MSNPTGMKDATLSLALRLLQRPNWADDTTMYPPITYAIEHANPNDTEALIEALHAVKPVTLAEYANTLLARPNAPTWALDTLEQIYTRNTPHAGRGTITRVRNSIIKHPNTTLPILLRFITPALDQPEKPEGHKYDPSYDWFGITNDAALALQRPEIPILTLEIAGQHHNEFVRAATLRNPNCPEHTRVIAALMGTNNIELFDINQH